jgi:hypothetical protein
MSADGSRSASADRVDQGLVSTVGMQWPRWIPLDSPTWAQAPAPALLLGDWSATGLIGI